MCNRRNFFKIIITGLAAVLSLPHAALAKKVSLSLDKAPKLKEIGGWLTLKIKGQQILLIRDDVKSVQALNPICSHQHCLVQYNPKSNQIECPCHKSTFDLLGKVLSGPAKSPLRRFLTTFQDNRIILSID